MKLSRFGKGIIIYSYHGIRSDRKTDFIHRNMTPFDDFRNHIALFKRLRVISIEELSAGLNNQGLFKGAVVVLTFDDGYQNNLLAAELLHQAHLPWSVFISTGMMGHNSTIWTSELSLFILAGCRKKIEICDKVWDLSTADLRMLAFQSIRKVMKTLPASTRKETMRQVRTQYPEGHLLELLEQYPGMRMLSWDELRHLADEGVTVGSHGVDHEIHHENQSPETCMHELVYSNHELRNTLGLECEFFSYPNGIFRGDSPDMLKKAGYRLGLTTKEGVVNPHDERYLLPRIEARASIRHLVTEYWQYTHRD